MKFFEKVIFVLKTHMEVTSNNVANKFPMLFFHKKSYLLRSFPIPAFTAEGGNSEKNSCEKM